MTTNLSATARNAMVNAVASILNGGSIQIRTGSQPASAATAATGTLLGTLTLSASAFGSATSGTATANAISDDTSADATGTAGWFRALNSSGTAVLDGAVGAELTLNTTAVTAGGVLKITSWTLSV